MATETNSIIKVKLAVPEASKHRGIGFYANNLTQALEKLTDKVQLVVDSPDLVHYPFFDIFAPTLPLYQAHPTLVTIHDLTPLVLADLYPKGVRGSLNLLRQRTALRGVKAILTDSENSSADIQRFFGIPHHKIFVTPLGVGQHFFEKLPVRKLNSLAKRLNLPPKFVLTVAGGPNPNKNLVKLSEATSELNLPLVIVGRGLLDDLPEGEIHPELNDLASLKKFSHLVLPGFVPDEDLIGLYQLASVYCQASLYEGFGLPLLEAMASGCLIISSNTSSLPEIYPKGTITFNPRSSEEIVAALNEVVTLDRSKASSRIRAGKARAAEFTWEQTARLTLKAYQWTYENSYRNY